MALTVLFLALAALEVVETAQEFAHLPFHQTKLPRNRVVGRNSKLSKQDPAYVAATEGGREGGREGFYDLEVPSYLGLVQIARATKDEVVP